MFTKTKTKTKLTHTFRFVKKTTARPNLFHENENENEMKLATYKILQDIGISPQCKQKSISSIHTLSSITDHVTKEEGRTAAGLTPKGIAASYSDLYLQ